MTKKLVFILFSLIFIFAIYLFYFNYDTVMNKISYAIDKLTNNVAIIPSTTSYKRKYKYETFSETNDFEPDNIEEIKSIYYTVINNGWNEFTFYCKRSYKTCVEDVRLVADDSNFISLINNYISPYNTFKNYTTVINGEKEIYISIEKIYTESEILSLEEKINNIMLDLAIDKNNITKNEIKTLHHYLLRNTTYDNDYMDSNKLSNSNKASGPLFNGKAVCSGYADAFALFMDYLNIPNFKIASEEHIWNVIYFNDEWTHVDVTWDDDEINNNNLLNFFMISTNQLLQKDDKDHLYNKELYKELY